MVTQVELMRFKFWFRLDSWLHSIRACPRWVCNRFDLACGMSREEVYRKLWYACKARTAGERG